MRPVGRTGSRVRVDATCATWTRRVAGGSATIGSVTTAARPAATVLLDLDGTLIDSAPGILGSLAAAFAELGIPLPDDGLPRTLLGPPLYRSLPPLVGFPAPVRARSSAVPRASGSGSTATAPASSSSAGAA